MTRYAPSGMPFALQQLAELGNSRRWTAAVAASIIGRHQPRSKWENETRRHKETFAPSLRNSTLDVRLVDIDSETIAVAAGRLQALNEGR